METAGVGAGLSPTRASPDELQAQADALHEAALRAAPEQASGSMLRGAAAAVPPVAAAPAAAPAGAPPAAPGRGGTSTAR